ncbi:hypothetical protein RAD10_33000 [Bradyrhizobium sp. 23AC]
MGGILLSAAKMLISRRCSTWRCARWTVQIVLAIREAQPVLNRRGDCLVHLLGILIAWCLVQSIAPIIFGQIFLLVPPVMVITVMPISIGGWGVREATMSLAFGFAGRAANKGDNVPLLFGNVFFIVGTVSGLIWILNAEKNAQGSAPIGVLG